MRWLQSFCLRQERLSNLVANLKSIDPQNLLQKGYAILFDEKTRSVITSTSSITQQQEVRMRLADGELLTTVKEVIKNDTTCPT
jgi:exodeoxyribonuclease VII large subunit